MEELNSINEENSSSLKEKELIYEELSTEIIEETAEIEKMKNEIEEKHRNTSNDFNIRPENVECEKCKQEKINNAYILLAIFIILFGISYVIKNKASFNQNNLGEDNKIIREIKAIDIDKIEILKNGKSSILENRDGSWKVVSQNNFIADQQAVKSLIDKSFELNRYILASENKEKFVDFEVDEKKGVNIKLYKGGEENINFYIGKAGPDFDSTYVRIFGDDAVYLSKGYVRYYFDKDEWIDLAIYNFEAEKTTKIALKYREVINNVMMEKIEGKWKIQGNSAKEADISKVDSVLNILAKLKAADIEYKKTAKECGFAAAPLVVRLELEDGEKKNLIIGGKIENDDYYVKREEDNTIYIINKATADSLMKKAVDF